LLLPQICIKIRISYHYLWITQEDILCIKTFILTNFNQIIVKKVKTCTILLVMDSKGNSLDSFDFDKKEKTNLILSNYRVKVYLKSLFTIIE
jgi:hypothetical protein